MLYLNSGDEMKENKKNNAATVYDWIDSFVFALVVVMILFSFVVKSYIVDGSSMYPTLLDGSRIFAYSFLYKPKSGDIVIIDENNGYGAPLVKRVVATGGQTIELNYDTFEYTIDGKPFLSPVENSEQNLCGETSFPLSVPEGYIFVMGDNRDNSLDSRYWGFLPRANVRGRPMFVYYSYEMDDAKPMPFVTAVRWERIFKALR